MINYTPETFNALTGPFLPFLGHPVALALPCSFLYKQILHPWRASGWLFGMLAAASLSLSVWGYVYIFIYIYTSTQGVNDFFVGAWVGVFLCWSICNRAQHLGHSPAGARQQKRAPLGLGSRSHVLEALGLQFSASTLSTIAMRLNSSVPIDNKVFRGL